MTGAKGKTNEPSFPNLPGSGIEDVEVRVADGRTEGLVRQVCGPPGEGGEPPLEVAGGGVPPGAGVAVEGALGLDLRGVGRQGYRRRTGN